MTSTNEAQMRAQYVQYAVNKGKFRGHHNAPVVDEDDYPSWCRAWQAALASQPRVTEEEEIKDVILSAICEAPNGEAVDYIAQALIAAGIVNVKESE